MMNTGYIFNFKDHGAFSPGGKVAASQMTTRERIAKGIVRNRLSRAPWCGGWGHYAVVDKKRWHWETVCHVSATDAEFAASLTAAIQRLSDRATI